MLNHSEQEKCLPDITAAWTPESPGCNQINIGEREISVIRDQGVPAVLMV